ncbi:MAG: NADH:ubiquinone oxidoreductase 27 kD subunit [Actinomycetia bacterium]|nr:NADH:ubiquinone oxidoreductase 27 kD subunit [Actinomycetes bacterium]
MTDPTTEPDTGAPRGEPVADATTEPAPELETAEPEPTGPSPLGEVAAELFARLEEELGDGIVDRAENHGTLIVRVRPEVWSQVARVARTRLECDYLSFVSGIDWLPAPKESDDGDGDTSSPAQPTEQTVGVTGGDTRFQVFGHVQSTRRHWGVTFKADVSDNAPEVGSWVPVYPGADWHERECWEMYGINFEGHPAMRKLYLPHEFEGNPARKDFPLLARVVKPWPGLVDVEPMPGEADDEAAPTPVGGDA